jgi:hypothetical protein
MGHLYHGYVTNNQRVGSEYRQRHDETVSSRLTSKVLVILRMKQMKMVIL